MKNQWYISSVAVVCAVWLCGCSFTREPIRMREDYFTPVSSVPHRQTTVYSSTELEQLRGQLADAVKSTKQLRDSLTAMNSYAGNVLVSARSMVEKVSELESREYLTLARQKQLEENVEKLKSENEKLGKEMSELLASNNLQILRPSPIVSTSHSILSADRDHYTHALILFAQKRYDESIYAFSVMLKHGIEEDLSDNCMYWMGEGYFAKGNFKKAIDEFQKVLAIPASNKLADAYFMLGRSFETVGDWKKAQDSYQHGIEQFPQSPSSNLSRIHLKALQRHVG